MIQQMQAGILAALYIPGAVAKSFQQSSRTGSGYVDPAQGPLGNLCMNGVMGPRPNVPISRL